MFFGLLPSGLMFSYPRWNRSKVRWPTSLEVYRWRNHTLSCVSPSGSFHCIGRCWQGLFWRWTSKRLRFWCWFFFCTATGGSDITLFWDSKWSATCFLVICKGVHLSKITSFAILNASSTPTWKNWHLSNKKMSHRPSKKPKRHIRRFSCCFCPLWIGSSFSWGKILWQVQLGLMKMGLSVPMRVQDMTLPMLLEGFLLKSWGGGLWANSIKRTLVMAWSYPFSRGTLP